MSPRDAAHETMDEVGTARHRHRAGAVRGVRADRLHPRHLRPVLPAVRADHRRLDAHLGLQLADACRRRWPRSAEAARHAAVRAIRSRGSAAGLPAASTAASTRLASGYARVGRRPRAGASSSCWPSMPGCSPARSGSCKRCRAASSRRSTRATPSSSSSCRTAPRCRAPTRSCSAPPRSCTETPGVAERRRLRRLLRRDLHQRLERRRDLRRVQALRGAHARRASPASADHRPAVRPPAGNRGGLHHRDPAAAGARHRQRRRLQDAAPGAHRRRRAPRARGGLRADGQRADQDPNLAGVFTTFSAQLAADLSRDRPHQGAHARTCRSPTSSRRCRSISARPTSTTSTPSAASTRCAPRPTSASASTRQDILRLKVRSSTGALVPLGTLVEIRDVTGPDLVQRYNMYTSVPVQGNAAPGVSSGNALDADGDASRAQTLPQGIGFEWTELAFQERADRQHRDLHLRASRCCSSSWCWRPSTRAGRCRSPSS